MRADIDHCAEILRRRDRDRFLAIQFAPAAARGGLYALYALNQELLRAHEAASEPLLASMRIQWWRDAVDGIAAGQPPGHPVARALASVAHRLDREELSNLMAARADESDAAPPADRDRLFAHLEATEGRLARLALGLLVDGEEAAATARAVGHAAAACGLLDVIRSLPLDAASRRRRIPDRVCAAVGLDEEDLYAGRPSAEVAAAVTVLAGWAGDEIASARRLAPPRPGRALPVLLGATLAESRLARLVRAGYDPRHPALGRPTGPGGVLRLIWRGARGRF